MQVKYVRFNMFVGLKYENVVFILEVYWKSIVFIFMELLLYLNVFNL